MNDERFLLHGRQIILDPCAYSVPLYNEYSRLHHTSLVICFNHLSSLDQYFDAYTVYIVIIMTVYIVI